jgi:hypothetical protein
MNRLTLGNRDLVRFGGVDALRLLQDVVTCDLENLEKGIARQGALLTPQGKIMFDFLVSRAEDNGFLFDIDTAQRDGFIKRMMLYRLRAKVDIEPVDDPSVDALWGDGDAAECLRDERFAERSDVFRCYGRPGANTATEQDYDQLRIDAGVPEGGRDFPLGDAFPHDAMMDLLRGVSFSKGCFVGQEVVSRMQHRGTARRRIARVAAEAALPEPGTAVVSGDRPLGTLGTVVGKSGLAMVRIDRVAKALEDGTDIKAGNVPVELSLPVWSGLSFRPDNRTASHGSS